MFHRALGVIVSPRCEWRLIGGEGASIGELYASYAAPIALTPVIAEFAGRTISGDPASAAVEVATWGYLMSLAGVALLGGISAALAPWFGGAGDFRRAQQLAVYGQTPAWLGGLFLVVPWIGWVVALIGSLYALFVYWLGVEEMTGVSGSRRIPYVLMAVAGAIAATLVLRAALDLALGHSAFVRQ
jgi:hypothetical protein